MPARFYLNALIHETRRRLAAPTSGRWLPEAAEPRFLQDFASDIEVSESVGDRDLLERVPSVFAWPIQFAKAVGDPAHPLHRTVLPEWRGLLGAFALQEWLGIRIEPREVIIPERADADEPRFVTILRNQLPRPDADWRRWWLFYVDDQLIGATSPWSIVYTPADYHTPAAIPFQKDGRLTDPIEYYAKLGGAHELTLLREWASLVIDRFDWGMTRQAHHAAGVKNALEAWRSDLRRATGQRAATRREGDVDLVPWKLDLTRAATTEEPYAHFLLPVVGQEGGSSPESDLLLAMRPEKKTPVLALSRQGVDPKQRVYRGIFGNAVEVEKLNAEGLANWRAKGGGVVPYGYVVPELLFLPNKIAAFLGENEAVQLDRLAIPLTPKFLEFFDVVRLGEIERILNWRLEAKTLVVELHLPLANRRTLRIERRYDLARDLVRVTGAVAFAAWPNFYDIDWKDNFAAYAALGEDLAVSPLLSTGGMLKQTETGERTVRVWETESPAVGFALFETDRRRAGRAETPLGLVLRRGLRAPEPLAAGKRWTVAVDFGTSSSNVMRKVDDKIEPLELQGRTEVVFTRDPEGDTLALLVGDNMFPTRTVVPPFATLLANSEATIYGHRATTKVESPFTTLLANTEATNHAHPAVSVQRIPRFTVFNASFERTQALADVGFRDVKWHGGPGESAPLRDYLRALVRMVLAEARAAGIGNVDFEWSYPLSLPKESRRSMEGFWTATGNTFNQRQLVVVRANAGMSESEAVCRYVNAHFDIIGVPVLAGDLSVMVDVGGGSSDIGFWKRGQLLDQVSMKLAGNAILAPLVRIPSFVESLIGLCRRSSGGAIRDVFTKVPEIGVNALLTEVPGQREVGYDPGLHPVALNLFDRGDEREAPWLYARTMVHIFFSGLGFLIGLLARRHMEGSQRIVLYLGGRGTSMLCWLTPVRTDRAAIIADAVRAGIAMQPAVKADVEVAGPAIRPIRELQPKGEVAAGLLVGSSAVKPAAPQDTTILGEGLWDSRPWDTVLSLEDLRRLEFPRTLDHGYMGSFLNQHLPRSVISLGLDEASIAGLTRVDTGTVEQLLAAGDAALQPVFAYELRAVMDQYTKMLRTSAT